MSREWNLEGLPGPTHHFGGLATGNLASEKHRSETSRPREAALQALDKMRLVYDLGVPVAVMPPQERPALRWLRALGFQGSDAQILTDARTKAPDLFYGVYSSSAMWTANAATVSPSRDSRDNRVHFTPANLVSQFHRALESRETARTLQRIFPPGDHFVHHAPLPSALPLRDEGAANHSRLCQRHSSPGWQLFVHGESPNRGTRPNRFPARQTLAASEAVARLHELDPDQTIHLLQHPDAIDAGVFHNDVIAVANERVLLHHADAFDLSSAPALNSLPVQFPHLCLLRIDAEELPLATAVSTYLFNSQLLTVGEDRMVLLAPSECEENDCARSCLSRLLDEENPIFKVHYVPVRESMKNGGGPACLRLRVVLNQEEEDAMHPGVRYHPHLDQRLRSWVKTHYREELSLQDLADPDLLEEARTGLDSLSALLTLPNLYDFQSHPG